MSSNTPVAVNHYRWDDMPAEPLKPGLTRKLITGERMMIAQVHLKNGEIVPKHSLANDQLTYILSGALRFWFGPNGELEIPVKARKVVVISTQPCRIGP